MNKALLTALATLLLAGLGGAAMAQTSSHDVTIKIPNLLSVRILNSVGNNPATTPAIEFDYQTDPTAYIAAVNNGGDVLQPTLVSNFADIVVFSNRTSWNVNVAATPIVYNDDYTLGTPGNGITPGDIRVAPSGVEGNGVNTPGAFTLAATGAIATGNRTQGWSSLGFSGNDYRLWVNGNEDPGTYTTTVTFSISAP